MWMYALAGDSSTFVAMVRELPCSQHAPRRIACAAHRITHVLQATADPYSQVAATLHQPDNDDSIEADEDEWDD